MSAELPFHPLANLFPMIEGAEFDELVSSIRMNGLREPVIIHEGMILDGRNRYRACRAAGVAPRLEVFDGLTDPLRFVIDRNLRRRHLNESQRALIAAQLANLKPGDNQHVTEVTGKPVTTIEEAAGLLNVSKDSVSLARKCLNEGTEEEVAAIRIGKARVHTVAKAIRRKETADERRSHVTDPDNKRRATRQLHAEMWKHLRDGLELLGHLPLPSEVVKMVRGKDGGLIDRRLDKTIQWLQEFRNAWQHGSSDARSGARQVEAEPEPEPKPDPNA